MFCFFTLLFSFCFVFDINWLWTISFSRSILFHILRYFHFCWSIGISFLVWSFYFIVKYVLFLTLLSFICFVSDFNCFRIILFWGSILFQIVRYFHFCWSIGISFLVWSFYFIVKYVLFLTLLSFIYFVPDFNCLWTILFWRSILFHILRYFYFCWSIGIRVLVWFLF